jgi:hypothetical protein
VIFYQERITADGFIVPARFTFPEPLKGKYIVNFFGAIALSELGFPHCWGGYPLPRMAIAKPVKKPAPSPCRFILNQTTAPRHFRALPVPTHSGFQGSDAPLLLPSAARWRKDSRLDGSSRRDRHDAARQLIRVFLASSPVQQ